MHIIPTLLELEGFCTGNDVHGDPHTNDDELEEIVVGAYRVADAMRKARLISFKWGYMSRPDFVTNEDIARWGRDIDNDPSIDSDLSQNPIIREVFYAGQYLVDRLIELDCPDNIIGRITFTAGKLSFGRKDPWPIHQDILNRYMDGTLEFERDSDLN